MTLTLLPKGKIGYINRNSYGVSFSNININKIIFDEETCYDDSQSCYLKRWNLKNVGNGLKGDSIWKSL